jgi:RNA polymerase primary sigma factor
LRTEADELFEAADEDLQRVRVRDQSAALDSLDGWFRAAKRFPLLTAQEEVALARDYEAGRRATEELATGSTFEGVIRCKLEQIEDRGEHARFTLICSNLRLVASIVRRNHYGGMERVDVMQEGVLGLMRAVEKFDWRMGYKLSTYATHWIRQATQRGIDDQGRMIRVPVHVVERLRGVRREAIEMQFKLGREPTIFELSETVGMDPAELAFLWDIEEVVSLDKPLQVQEGGATLGDFVAARQASVEEATERFFEARDLSRWLDCLSERERTVIELRFGLRDAKPWTLEAIGTDMGVTRERVRQIEVKALEKLGDNAKKFSWRQMEEK